MLNCFLGFDAREKRAYEVAVSSLKKHTQEKLRIDPLDAEALYLQRHYWRPIERKDGRMRDHLSDAWQSTEFASTRFLVPFLQRTGWALFCDCDVVFLGDVAELFALADERYAVMVVKHDNGHTPGLKMDNQVQQLYSRKNWSSVILWNCGHHAHNRLSEAQVNSLPGELLHRFWWLRDSEIGALPAGANWLVNIEPKPDPVTIAHFTLGGPWLPNWEPQPNDCIWTDAEKDCRASG